MPTLQNVPVEFPFAPYPQQEDLMAALIKSLQLVSILDIETKCSD
jgi:hypothetical protein